MAIISKETWSKFTKEEQDKLIRLYTDEQTCYDKYSVWFMLQEFFGEENLNQTEMENGKHVLSKEEQDKIIGYCRNKLNEVREYLSLAKSIDDVGDALNDFAEAYINDSEEIGENVYSFSFVFDQIMIYGYVTPCGVVLDTNVSYSDICSDNNDIYEVDINARTIK